jgi:hypothetical protein
MMQCLLLSLLDWGHSDMPSRNLEIGQFQIGDLIMGRHTMFKVESLDIGNYDVNVQDYQAQSSNELRFGQDTLKPTPIQMTIHLTKNKILENVAGLMGSSKILNFDNDPQLGDIQREWRAEDIFSEWNQIKPLYFRGGDGVTKMFFGRPGKFGYTLHRLVDSAYYNITAEFRRSDTFAYSETEYYANLDLPDTPANFFLTRGNAPSWIRVIMWGPMTNPVIHFGTSQIALDWTLAADELVELTSYPWLGRRIINSDGLSLAAKTDTYLEKVKIYDHAPIEIYWSSSGAITSNSKMRVYWHDAYQLLD